jgi:hypothetical protein
MDTAITARLPLSARQLKALIAGLIAGLLIPLILIIAVIAVISKTVDGIEQACATASGPASLLPLVPGRGGAAVGASSFGGPSDPSSGHIGASGSDLDRHPDSYAELAGRRPVTFQTAVLLGGLAYETPLRITYRRHSLVAYKRDIGFGGTPVSGQVRRIDLWYRIARRLGLNGLGVVRVAPPPATGAANLQGLTPPPPTAASATAGCPKAGLPGVLELTHGPRAKLLASGLAAAPAAAPVAVKQMIAAGNQIVGRPYGYGAGHGSPVSSIRPAYDCSSSASHLLAGAGLLSIVLDSRALMRYGRPGLGRWVSIFADPGHVYLYVAGLRWDTHNTASGDGPNRGIGWHQLVRGRRPGDTIRHPGAL